MSSEITCLACHRVKQRHDPYLDLSLDLPGHKIITVRNRQPRPLRLHDCFRDFSRAEQLHASTEAMCADCTPPPRQTKQLRIFTLPRVLVVHLKRFNWALALGQKIRRYVQFPLRGLCLDPYLAENAPPESSGVVYDLTCVVVHHGLRIDFGHYTSYCLNRSEKRWYHFDDERVTPIDDEVVARSEAYILFYSKRE
jgi:ubiquitin carboxyl-terminal hydrolase 3